MLRNTLVLGCFPFAVLSTHAADLYTPELARCMNSSGGVTPAMIECISKELKIQDARLNSAYKDLMSQISEPRKKDLLETQRTWLKYRDLNCKFYNDPDGGTMARVSSNECFLRMTAERAKELKDLAP